MPVEIIAEIGINANGSTEIAKNMILMAKECGADYVKFQKRDIETVYGFYVEWDEQVRDSQGRFTGEIKHFKQPFLETLRKSPWGTTQRDQKIGLEFEKTQYDEIDAYCKEIGIPWFASAWDVKSLEFLDQYDCPHQKVASAMATHCDFLRAVAERKKHAYISTGMCTMSDIEKAVDIFQRRGCAYTLMHCVAAYPCEDRETNLLMIKTLLERFGPPVGYSSHDVGVGPSIIATVLGASAIEKHITLDRAMYGSDQAASLERHGLEWLVKEVRGVADCMGDGRKSIKDIEQGVALKLRYWESNG